MRPALRSRATLGAGCLRRQVAGPLGAVRETDRTAGDLGSPKLFFESSHVSPLFSNFERLFFDNGIGSPLGELLGLAGLGPVFFGLACRHGEKLGNEQKPRLSIRAKRGIVQTWPNIPER